jgi:aryl-alcohol dehydrogenase-like predicted oxidoreductase
VSDLDENDFRKNNPRFAGRNLAANRERFAPLLTMAEGLDVTPAQLALAWLLHQGEDIVPIPGTRRLEHVDENARAVSVALTPAILARINELAPPGLAEGATLM